MFNEMNQSTDERFNESGTTNGKLHEMEPVLNGILHYERKTFDEKVVCFLAPRFVVKEGVDVVPGQILNLLCLECTWLWQKIKKIKIKTWQ